MVMTTMTKKPCLLMNSDRNPQQTKVTPLATEAHHNVVAMVEDADIMEGDEGHSGCNQHPDSKGENQP